MCGPTQCGKTELIKKIILHIDDVIKPTPDKLVYLYTADQSNYDDIKDIIRTNSTTSNLKTFEFVDCNQGIPSIAELKAKLGNATLLVLDDLMVLAASNSKNVENLNNIVSRDSHHTNTSVIFVCQNLNFGNGKLRNARVNSQYHVLFNNLSDLRDIEMIASNKKIKLGKIHKIIKSVEKKNQFGYVLFDGSPRSYSNTRVRSGILPGEKTTIYECT
jgi:hypothetical protein